VLSMIIFLPLTLNTILDTSQMPLGHRAVAKRGALHPTVISGSWLPWILWWHISLGIFGKVEKPESSYLPDDEVLHDMSVVGQNSYEKNIYFPS